MSLQDGVAPANFICSIVLFYFLRVGGGGGGGRSVFAGF